VQTWLYLLALGAAVTLAYKTGQANGRRESGVTVSGELVSMVPGASLPFPTASGLRFVTPSDRDWCQALAYHVQLAATCRRLGI